MRVTCRQAPERTRRVDNHFDVSFCRQEHRPFLVIVYATSSGVRAGRSRLCGAWRRVVCRRVPTCEGDVLTAVCRTTQRHIPEHGNSESNCRDVRDPCSTHGKDAKRIQKFGRKREGQRPLGGSRRRREGTVEMAVKIARYRVVCVLGDVSNGRTAFVFRAKQSEQTERPSDPEHVT
jgi:hypothetical protein